MSAATVVKHEERLASRIGAELLAYNSSKAIERPICERVHARFLRWLGKNGLLRADEHESNERPEQSCLDSCTEAALGMGNLGKVNEPAHAGATGTPNDGEAPPLFVPELPRSRKGKHVGEACGFSIHAGVAVAAGNTLGRELLFRYCARPPLSLERLTALPDGRFAYRLKTPWRKDETHRIMTPTQLLGRLAALVPPPRHPLIRFHGVLAPHSAWRASVVPAPRSPFNARGSIACVEPVAGEPVPNEPARGEPARIEPGRIEPGLRRLHANVRWWNSVRRQVRRNRDGSIQLRYLQQEVRGWAVLRQRQLRLNVTIPRLPTRPECRAGRSLSRE